MSQRTEIRTALAQALTGLPSGAHVFQSRTRPLDASQLPAIMVFSGSSEAPDIDFDSAPEVTHWQLRADVLVRDGDGNEAIADQILAEMLAAVAGAADLNRHDRQARFMGTGEVELDDSLERPALRLPVLFEVIYL